VNGAFSVNSSSVSFRHVVVTQLVRIIPEWSSDQCLPMWEWLMERRKSIESCQ